MGEGTTNDEDLVISSQNKNINRQALLSMMKKYTYKFMNQTGKNKILYQNFGIVYIIMISFHFNIFYSTNGIYKMNKSNLLHIF